MTEKEKQLAESMADFIESYLVAERCSGTNCPIPCRMMCSNGMHKNARSVLEKWRTTDVTSNQKEK